MQYITHSSQPKPVMRVMVKEWHLCQEVNEDAYVSAGTRSHACYTLYQSVARPRWLKRRP